MAFDRGELKEICRRAKEDAEIPHMHLYWQRALLNLADAADRLDAMIARSTELGPDDKCIADVTTLAEAL